MPVATHRFLKTTSVAKGWGTRVFLLGHLPDSHPLLLGP